MAKTNFTTSKFTSTRIVEFLLEIDDFVPSFKLLINPSTLETRQIHKTTEQRTRWSSVQVSPYVFHAHHDELDILSMSGKSAMFVSNEGITRTNRTKTRGYENIEQLIAIYRNNGVNYTKKQSETVAKNSKNAQPSIIQSIGTVNLIYSPFLYKGFFNSLSITENDTSPFNFDFSFEFKVIYTFSSQ